MLSSFTMRQMVLVAVPRITVITLHRPTGQDDVGWRRIGGQEVKG